MISFFLKSWISLPSKMYQYILATIKRYLMKGKVYTIMLAQIKYSICIVACHLPRGSKLRWREDMGGGLSARWVRPPTYWATKNTRLPCIGNGPSLGQTVQPWVRRQTDRRYQVHYLPASQSIINTAESHSWTCIWSYKFHKQYFTNDKVTNKDT